MTCAPSFCEFPETFTHLPLLLILTRYRMPSGTVSEDSPFSISGDATSSAPLQLARTPVTQTARRDTIVRLFVDRMDLSFFPDRLVARARRSARRANGRRAVSDFQK